MNKYENQRKIKRNKGLVQGILALIMSQFIIKALGLLYKWYLTNKDGFGDEGNAIYSAGFAIYALLLTISSIGVPNAVSKLVSVSIARNDYRGAHKILKIAVGTFTSIGLVATILLYNGSYYIANNILTIPEAEISLKALSPAIFFVSIISVFRGYFNGREELNITAISQAIEQFIKTVLTIVFVASLAVISNRNTIIMAAGANFATSMATLGSLFYLWTYYKYRKNELAKEIIYSTTYKNNGIFRTIKNILMVSIPMSLSAILAVLNRNIDSTTVKRLLETFMPASLALKQYGMLSGKVDTLVTLPLSFNIAIATALVPTIAKANEKKDRNGIENKVGKALLTTMLVGLPATVGMIIFARTYIKFVVPKCSRRNSNTTSKCNDDYIYDARANNKWNITGNR